MINRLILGMILTLTLTFGATVGPGIQKEFDARVGEYLKLRKRAIQGIPALKPKATPEQIQAHKTAVAQAVREARPDAQQGTILTPEIQEHFREIIRSEMRGRQGVPAKAAAKQGNPATEKLPAPVPVKVNAPYPDSAPLSTVPATLLLRLPKLPKELDFRFVGRNLILRDVDASLIVDYIPNAAP
jgi:hypothetical protein